MRRPQCRRLAPSGPSCDGFSRQGPRLHVAFGVSIVRIVSSAALFPESSLPHLCQTPGERRGCHVRLVSLPDGRLFQQERPPPPSHALRKAADSENEFRAEDDRTDVAEPKSANFAPFRVPLRLRCADGGSPDFRVRGWAIIARIGDIFVSHHMRGKSTHMTPQASAQATPKQSWGATALAHPCASNFRPPLPCAWEGVGTIRPPSFGFFRKIWISMLKRLYKAVYAMCPDPPIQEAACKTRETWTTRVLRAPERRFCVRLSPDLAGSRPKGVGLTLRVTGPQ